MKSSIAFAVVSAALVVLAACGDKVSESKAAKDIGNIPKQTVDKATTGVENAAAQGADRLKDAEATK